MTGTSCPAGAATLFRIEIAEPRTNVHLRANVSANYRFYNSSGKDLGEFRVFEQSNPLLLLEGEYFLAVSLPYSSDAFAVTLWRSALESGDLQLEPDSLEPNNSPLTAYVVSIVNNTWNSGPLSSMQAKYCPFVAFLPA